MRRSTFFQAIFISSVLASVLLSGCSLFSSKPEKTVKTDAGPPEMLINGEKVTKFSENDQMPNIAQRNYKRMNRQKMEEESELNAQAGSMWVMDGQGAYLFSQNKIRKEGDLLNVRIEGAAQKQIETKVAVIKKLLKQLEEEEARQKLKQKDEEDRASGAKERMAENKTADANRAPASEDPAVVAANAAATAANPNPEKEETVAIESVPTRITERQSDGSYRVKGQQPFMIGKREYKVIVTGSIRPEDYNDEGINSGKLLEGQFDVVSLRRKE